MTRREALAEWLETSQRVIDDSSVMTRWLSATVPETEHWYVADPDDVPEAV